MSPPTVDEYLAAVPADRRAVLERIRGLIREAAPDATEAIAYGMPSFRLGGRWLVGYASTKQGLSLYAGGAPTRLFADELERAGYRTWKGTINFTVERPLSDDLVAKLVEARVAEFRGG
jgi:uncharacterized protein YdhG (YjbR/CyaY superfamily)